MMCLCKDEPTLQLRCLDCDRITLYCGFCIYRTMHFRPDCTCSSTGTAEYLPRHLSVKSIYRELNALTDEMRDKFE